MLGERGDAELFELPVELDERRGHAELIDVVFEVNFEGPDLHHELTILNDPIGKLGETNLDALQISGNVAKSIRSNTAQVVRIDEPAQLIEHVLSSGKYRVGGISGQRVLESRASHEDVYRDRPELVDGGGQARTNFRCERLPVGFIPDRPTSIGKQSRKDCVGCIVDPVDLRTVRARSNRKAGSVIEQSSQ